jgi:hypothetical protein
MARASRRIGFMDGIDTRTGRGRGFRMWTVGRRGRVVDEFSRREGIVLDRMNRIHRMRRICFGLESPVVRKEFFPSSVACPVHPVNPVEGALAGAVVLRGGAL